MGTGTPAHVKIAFIGGGSRLWAPQLMTDLALSRSIAGEIALYDIDRGAAGRNAALGKEIFAHRDARSRFVAAAVDALRDALDGAQFVVLSIEPGPTRLRYADLEIPRSYGILQTVGDTTGPGGILRSLRAAPLFMGFAHEIAAACPRAWVINYTNPMAVCVAALHEAEPALKVFGCCHEVYGTQRRLAALAAAWLDTAVPPRKEIELQIAGVNHFTFAASASWRGRDLMPRLLDLVADPALFADRTDEALQRKREERWFDSDGIIAYDFLRSFGVLGAAGDRHLAEFVPWYLASEEVLHRWGVILTPYEWRVRRMQESAVFDPGAPLVPSGEEGVEQMEALLGLGPVRTNVNVPNHGQMPGLPAGAVVETYATLEEDRLTPLPAPRLPDAIESLVSRASMIQRMTLTAVRERKPEPAFAALLADPLMRGSTDAARLMFDEMLAYVKDYLPWKGDPRQAVR